MNEQIKHIVQPFIEQLQQNEQYCAWQQAAQALEIDEQAQHLITEFNEAKMVFAEAQRFGKYHPDYQTYQRTLAQAKRNLDQYPLIAEYKTAQKRLQALLNQMSIALGNAISPHLIVPSDFFSGKRAPKKSCGSSCQCG